MKFAFGEISPGTTQYEIQDPKWCLVSELSCEGPINANFTLRRSEEDQAVYMAGQANVDVRFTCDRCGEEFLHQLKTEYYYIFKQGVDDHLHLIEVECSEVDCQTIHLKEPVIDVSEILREQILLSVPERRVCEDDCKGLCPTCGTDLNQSRCKCSKDIPDSPFAVLKQLKKH